MKSKENNIDKLFLLSVKKLGSSDLSFAKMKEFLFKKGATKLEVEIIIEKLNHYSLLNEDELIKNVIKYANSKHYGYLKIINILKKKEVSQDKIDKLSKDEHREIKEANMLLESLVKRYKNKNTVNLKRNVYLGLIRHGFDENLASSLIDKVYNSPQKELNMLKLDYLKLFSSYSRKTKGKELTDKLVKSLLSKGYKKEDIYLVIKEQNNEVD